MIVDEMVKGLSDIWRSKPFQAALDWAAAVIFGDVAFLLAPILVSYGAWLIYRPSGFIIAGVLWFVLGFFNARGRNMENSSSRH